jgi:hypothetical protein
MEQFGRQRFTGLVQRRELLENSVLELVGELSEVHRDVSYVAHGWSPALVRRLAFSG